MQFCKHKTDVVTCVVDTQDASDSGLTTVTARWKCEDCSVSAQVAITVEETFLRAIGSSEWQEIVRNSLIEPVRISVNHLRAQSLRLGSSSVPLTHRS